MQIPDMGSGKDLCNQGSVFSEESARFELRNIAEWWIANSFDNKRGGFFGEVDFFAKPQPMANKGIILNSRILWFFSEIAMFEPKESYRQAATRAFDYIMEHFDDKANGGAFWELDYQGNVVNGKKQTYAQCFCIYAFSAYYRLTNHPLALDKALEYLALVEKHARDNQFGGYVEACSESWKSVTDYRLSEKDLNLPKSMNTHLHVLEAFGSIYLASPNQQTESALRYVLHIFESQILDESNYHLKLFFDMQWQDKSETYSYGHDIEASWLIWEAVELLGDEKVLQRLKPKILKMAEVCLKEGIGDLGQVCDEFDFASKHKSQASSWWIQAEALVGFLTAYKLSGDKKYRDICDGIWRFVCDYHLDKVNGEWHWLSSADNNTVNPIYKVGFWKAPYHNGRAMMEICKLFNRLEE